MIDAEDIMLSLELVDDLKSKISPTISASILGDVLYSLSKTDFSKIDEQKLLSLFKSVARFGCLNIDDPVKQILGQMHDFGFYADMLNQRKNKNAGLAYTLVSKIVEISQEYISARPRSELTLLNLFMLRLSSTPDMIVQSINALQKCTMNSVRRAKSKNPDAADFLFVNAFHFSTCAAALVSLRTRLSMPADENRALASEIDRFMLKAPELFEEMVMTILTQLDPIHAIILVNNTTECMDNRQNSVFVKAQKLQGLLQKEYPEDFAKAGKFASLSKEPVVWSSFHKAGFNPSPL